MTVKINADTSDGLKFVSDTSGTVDIQSNGTTKMQVTSSAIVGKQNIILDAGTNFCIGAADDVVIGRATDNRMTFNTNGVERGRILEGGHVLFGTAAQYGSSDALVHINVDAAATGGGAVMSQCSGTGDVFHYHFRNGNGGVGGIKTTSSSSAFVTSSDYRLKENVSYTFDATSRLKQLKPCRFNFIADADTTLDGFLAHEVSSIVPEAIHGTKDATKVQNVYDEDNNKIGTETVPDYQGIDQSKLVPLLVKTIQELEARITALESE